MRDAKENEKIESSRGDMSKSYTGHQQSMGRNENSRTLPSDESIGSADHNKRNQAVDYLGRYDYLEMEERQLRTEVQPSMIQPCRSFDMNVLLEKEEEEHELPNPDHELSLTLANNGEMPSILKSTGTVLCRETVPLIHAPTGQTKAYPIKQSLDIILSHLLQGRTQLVYEGWTSQHAQVSLPLDNAVLPVKRPIHL